MIVEENIDEKAFNEMLMLWVDDKMTWDELMMHYPPHNQSIIKYEYQNANCIR